MTAANPSDTLAYDRQIEVFEELKLAPQDRSPEFEALYFRQLPHPTRRKSRRSCANTPKNCATPTPGKPTPAARRKGCSTTGAGNSASKASSRCTGRSVATKCGQSGYKGRIGLHALMVADDELKKLIQQRARVAELFSSAVNSGMRTLKRDGRGKVLMGLTDLKMVRSVCIK
ncbi:type II secretory ATPase GspE/PulE/Tfp pilus assembly ATPase PilB-like protein [Polaromonas sp. CG_9.5]|uniref:ATPase, T2SS/T4P/T4SS family n=1 Tax=Polaromonas sp. CG_9.5 TaxID=3071705 RepID=UPI002E00B0D2|nr:type II secretory ATPase GspE/PulE/Tfp pilus assembly ATPase PilB-like protein [Polaromonas sp. CG_9.5]